MNCEDNLPENAKLLRCELNRWADGSAIMSRTWCETRDTKLILHEEQVQEGRNGRSDDCAYRSYEMSVDEMLAATMLLAEENWYFAHVLQEQLKPLNDRIGEWEMRVQGPIN